MSHQHFDLSYISILRVIIVLAGLAFLYIIRDVVALIFVAVFLTAAITPSVNWLHKHNIPRGLAVLIIYLIGFAVLSLVVVLIIPPVTEQINQLLTNSPELLQRIITGFADLQAVDSGVALDQVQDSLQSVQSAVASATQGIFSTVASIFGGIIFFAALLVLTFYMIINDELLMRLVHMMTPKQYHDYAEKFIERSQKQLGKWLRGQLFLMLFIAVLTYIGLSILGVKYALVLALVAGLFEFIPYAGPILAGIPAVIIALSTSPLLAVAVVILYFVVQQIENNILVPKIMQKAIGLNPLVTIIAILIGAKLGGIVGAIVAVPVVTVVTMFVGDVYDRRHTKTQ